MKQKYKNFSDWSYTYKVAYTISIISVCLSIIAGIVALCLIPVFQNIADAAVTTIPDYGQHGEVQTHQFAPAQFLIRYIWFASISFVGIILSLLYKIPLIASINKHASTSRELSIGFNVCTLLFLSKIAGILLLCHKDIDSDKEYIQQDEEIDLSEKLEKVDNLLSNKLITEEEAKDLKRKIVNSNIDSLVN